MFELLTIIMMIVALPFVLIFAAMAVSYILLLCAFVFSCICAPFVVVYQLLGGRID